MLVLHRFFGSLPGSTLCPAGGFNGFFFFSGDAKELLTGFVVLGPDVLPAFLQRMLDGYTVGVADAFELVTLPLLPLNLGSEFPFLLKPHFPERAD